MNLGDFIKKIKYEILDSGFNQLEVTFYEDMIRFKLYDDFDVVIEYNGDVDDMQVVGLTTTETNVGTYGTDFGTIKDIYKVMELIKENHELLDVLLKLD